MSSHNHQDWEKVVLTKKTKTAPTFVHTEKKSVNNFDPEQQTKLTVSNLELANALRNTRTEKKISQSQLDQSCNFPKNTVRDYENCKAVINPNQLNKLNTVLGVKLPRPKKN